MKKSSSLYNKDKNGRSKGKFYAFGLFFYLTLFLNFPSLASAQTVDKYTKNFHFQYPTQWKAQAEFIIKHAEKDLKRLEDLLSYKTKKRFQVRLSAPGKQFANIQPGRWHPHNWIAGLAYPTKGLMTLRIKRIEGLKGLHQTFRHELSHLLLTQATQFKKMPLWLIEGAAMLHSDDIGDFERFVKITQAKWSGQLPDLEQLAKGFPQSSSQVEIAYAVSYEYVRFLQNENNDFLKNLLPILRSGVPFSKAFPKAMGRSWDDMQEEWERYLNLNYQWFVIVFNGSTIWMLTVIFFIFSYRKIKRRRSEELKKLDMLERSDDGE